MAGFSRIAFSLCVLLASSLAAAQATGPLAAGGLVRVKSKNVDEAYVLPGADFRPYRKVLLKNAEVAFQRNWLRDVNSGSAAGLSGRVTKDDAQKIVAAARSGFDEIWAAAFKSAGYEIVAAPGDDVLQVMPSVVDLYVNAPDKRMSSPSRSYTVEAGEATLNLEVRDSVSGTLLGRVHDRRQTGRNASLQWTDGVTNRAEFGQLFANWARIATRGLEELKANSPVPETLKPGEKLAPRK
jgi:hypothetical protein